MHRVVRRDHGIVERVEGAGLADSVVDGRRARHAAGGRGRAGDTSERECETAADRGLA